jgi:spore coat polysaccharide biosynthesis predicted glycosyltransferase SpsG
MIFWLRDKRMAHVRIVCDGGGSYGFGNLRRSITLAESLRRSGYRVSVDAVSEGAQRLLPPFQNDDGPGDVWLLDLPYEGDAWAKRAQASKCPVAALDFIGAGAPDLNISIFDHGHAPAAAKHLVGLQYAIIRPDVVALAPAAEGEGVVVMIGGGDRDGLGERVAELIQTDTDGITLIEGPLAEKSRELAPSIKRLSSPPELAHLMATCEWAVTSGGGTMLEMMCLGKAIHVVPRTPFEVSLAQSILEQGALLGVGMENIGRSSRERRHGVAATARRLVDGKGTARIATALQALL